MAKLCVECADCLAPKTPGAYRCGHSNAVGAHHEPLGELPRPFGVDLVDAPLCEDMRKEGLVFETCGPEGDWFRTADQKETQEADRHLDAADALAKKEAADRQAALVATGAAA